MTMLVLLLLLAACQPTSDEAVTVPPSARSVETIANSSGRLLQTLYHLEARAAQNGWSASDHIRAAEVYQALGRTADAVIHWQAAVQDVPSPTVMRTLIDSLISLQRWPDASSTLQQYLTLEPADVRASYQLALILAASDPIAAQNYLAGSLTSADYAEPAAELSTLLATEQPDAVRALNVGLWLMSHDYLGQAELAFRYAADIGYPFAEALAYVGLVRAFQGKPGLQWIDQAVTLNPGDPRVHTIRGLYLRAQGETGASLNAFAQAASLDPYNPALMAELAAAYQQAGDLPQAEYWFRSAAQFSDSDDEYDRLLAQFYAGLAAPFATAAP